MKHNLSKKKRTLDSLAILDEHGHRQYIYPADVQGWFTRLKPWVYTALIIIYAVIPWIHIGGHPAILIDIPARRFYLLGKVFNAQDFYLVYFFLTGIGFTLITISALFGRLWCGWACPQTVFLEGVYRRVERWIEGPAPRRLKLARGPWTFEKIWKRALKHGIFFLFSAAIAHIFVSYFTSLPKLFDYMRSNPAENWTAFMWSAVLTGIIYFNFFWFREQLCLIICPYGRLQSALQDDDTVVIGYDKLRGEPRGKAKKKKKKKAPAKAAEAASETQSADAGPIKVSMSDDAKAASIALDPPKGDCVDCGRCVQVCPTGIDIRNGLQLECIGCAACIDACDEIMVKLDRPTGLIRYDSLNGLEKKTKRFLRPRTYGYLVAGTVGALVALFMFINHMPFEANALRLAGAPYTLDEGKLRNQVMVHLINKHAEPSDMSITAKAKDGVEFLLPQAKVTLQSLESRQIPVVLTMDKATYRFGDQMTLTVHDAQSGLDKVLTLPILGPR